MKVLDAMIERRSISHFDPDVSLSDDELNALFKAVCHTPSSFNLQHWRFIAVRDKAMKSELKAAAYHQRQLEDCSAVIVVTAGLHVHEYAKDGWKVMDPAIADRLESMVIRLYKDNPELQRDEAIRSGSLAAMALMLVATEMGLDTSPMIGYDVDAVTRITGVPEDHVIVMLVCVGKALKEPRPSSGRFDVSEIVRLETFEGPALVATSASE